MKMEGKTSIKVDVKLNVPDETAAACAVILGFYLDEHPEKTLRVHKYAKDEGLETKVEIE